MFDYEANTVLISFKVSRSLFNKINDTAKKAHLQRSTFIRKAVIDYIEKVDETVSKKDKVFKTKRIIVY